jgi:hypothetical protein
LVPLPLTFFSSKFIPLIFINRLLHSPDSVGSSTQFMGRYVSYGHGLASGQGGKSGRIRHSFSRCICSESRLMSLFHRYLTSYPGSGQFYSLSRSFIVQIGLLKQVQDLIHRPAGWALANGHGAPGALVVLHDLNLVARFADRVLLLVQGQLRALGTVSEVLQPGLLSEAFGIALDVVQNPIGPHPLVVAR